MVFQGFVRPCHQVLSVQQVMVEPLSSDDWEILVKLPSLEWSLLYQLSWHRGFGLKLCLHSIFAFKTNFSGVMF